VVVGKRVDVTIGEVPTAFVVKAPNSNIKEQDILDHLDKRTSKIALRSNSKSKFKSLGFSDLV